MSVNTNKIQLGSHRIGRAKRTVTCTSPTFDSVEWIPNFKGSQRGCVLKASNTELLKYGGEVLEYQIFKLIIKLWREEEIPNEWDTGNIIPIHKKGDKTVCSNYRGITLLSVCYKVFTMIIKEKLEPYIEHMLGLGKTDLQ